MRGVVCIGDKDFRIICLIILLKSDKRIDWGSSIKRLNLSYLSVNVSILLVVISVI